ncbi:hypothetical protein D9619_006157 [Psilocybe cf. subviscida]|uniref:Shr3 amino acid permease chaperone n=1 Tax=Psilocybe cf. subviscida TaxID=2480587 RepID=A0A8H5B4Y0_9AGAR|nr:hypothetical protein D9619_006157 [Psilocybe cf. subviscida]
MGFKQAAILVPVSFFLGVLFICFNIDHVLLWGTITDEVVADGFQFYTTFYNAPPAIKALLHGMWGVGLIGFLSKLFSWSESAVFFDGSSLAVYVFSIVVYLTVTVQSLRTIVDPLPGVDTRDDQIMALKVLSAGNTIIIGCLGLILALQAGQVWASRAEAKALAKMIAEEQAAKLAVPTEKKEQ